MANPLVELRKILGGKPSKSTGVVRAVGSTITVVTPSGSVSALLSDGIKVGDCVLVNGNVIVGVVPPAEDLPLYHL